MQRISSGLSRIVFITLLIMAAQPLTAANASDKGSLQAQIPEFNLSQIDPQIKNQCHAESVSKSGFDPNDPNNPTKSDYQKQHFQAMGQGLLEELVMPRRYAQWRSRDRANTMAKDLKAQSERAQNYVKTYRECLAREVRNNS